MQMGAGFYQSLHLIAQPRLRCQEERRVALAIAQVDRPTLGEEVL